MPLGLKIQPTSILISISTFAHSPFSFFPCSPFATAPLCPPSSNAITTNFKRIIGNLLVCLAICVERRLRNSGVGNWFLISLAMADLFVGKSAVRPRSAPCNPPASRRLSAPLDIKRDSAAESIAIRKSDWPFRLSESNKSF